LSVRRLSLVVGFLGLVAAISAAQVATPKTPDSTTPAAAAPAPGDAGKVTPPVLQSDPAKIIVETRLTASQKNDLLASEDQIFHFASQDTGLPIVKPVKCVFVTRDAVNQELRKKFDEDKSNKRMERSELVLKKFGLLDRDFQLRPFLLSLLTEQIAGFYDNKTKQMTLLDWVPIDEQKPVMAHELTHALQDQKVHLSKWEDPDPDAVAKNIAEDNLHIATDEAGTTREAVLEGQAMVSFADYYLDTHGFKGKTLRDVPQMGEKLVEGAGDQSDSPVLARAPLVLQQALLFPYTSGLVFEQAVLVSGGPERAFAGVLDAPPNSSAEILHPADYLAKKVEPVLRLPDIHPALSAAGWVPYDVGVMGELDVRMTAELFGGRPLALALAPEWDGGIYYAAQKKDASDADKATTKSVAILYAQRWKDADSARSFFHIFEEELPRQYDGLTRRKADEKDDDERVYSTREGDVVLSRQDNMVWISEGFDAALGRSLRDVIVTANLSGTGPVMSAGASTPDRDLLGGMSAWIGSFGMLRILVDR
jgi:hypothetical protein